MNLEDMLKSTTAAISINPKRLIEGIAQAVELEFPEGKEPEDFKEAMCASHHVLDGVCDVLKKMSEKGRFIRLFADQIGLDKYYDSPEEDAETALNSAAEALKELKENMDDCSMFPQDLKDDMVKLCERMFEAANKSRKEATNDE